MYRNWFESWDPSRRRENEPFGKGRLSGIILPLIWLLLVKYLLFIIWWCGLEAPKKKAAFASELWFPTNATVLIMEENANETDFNTSTANEWPNTEKAKNYYKFYDFCREYIIPVLCVVGIVFNLASIFVIFSRALHLQRSLRIQFAFLNISDT